MNKIEAVLNRSIYPIYEDEYLDIKIDEYFLGSILSIDYPSASLDGLIPTLTNWLDNVSEQSIVWQRILPAIGSNSMAPILMCPDDHDFSCDLIIVEIERDDSSVFWKRFGRNKSYEFSNPVVVGNEVDWFPNSKYFRFDINSYLEFVMTFKNALQK
ncbi:hypothetical protein EHQ81_08490 [Leptospira selangorensis]|uniref:Uncharacterized protein n=1 Tax=Leptospira selangorensis TaxID=2484982 RepID=A0A5F2BZA6_9LEPT|nr:hypothetical protein [Leptospira selangorensis]TGM14210.1 hypothetical protein EHQ81_08490 [Leptospira selangorensis]TGM16893.1 hypothetical protein EHQ82_16855 [Leptospira selangorensis]